MAINRIHLTKALAPTGFVAVLFVSGEGDAQYTRVTPHNMSGYKLNTPGSASPWTHVNPNNIRGYTVTTSASSLPYTYRNPGMGGYAITTPGANLLDPDLGD
jgi:hypothetical protein